MHADKHLRIMKISTTSKKSAPSNDKNDPVFSQLEGHRHKIDEIDKQLYQAYHELQVSLRTEGQELLRSAASDDEDYENFKNRFEEFYQKTTEINRADLARYVCHRKSIIEFLKRQLARQTDGKYSLEDRIHNIIFPMGKTSNDIAFKEHNLWLIDERLAFHIFLSSNSLLYSIPSPISNSSNLSAYCLSRQNLPNSL